MPGQACSSKIGQMKTLELRKRAKRTLGAKFSIKEYHNTVLGSGSIPRALLSGFPPQPDITRYPCAPAPHLIFMM